MKKHGLLKRMGAMMLTLALLVGMLSVCGTFSFTASAKTETAEKFVADFSEVATMMGDTAIPHAVSYTPIGDTSTVDGKINTWMREKFASKTNNIYSTYRAWISQKSDEISDKEGTGWGNNGNNTQFKIVANGVLRQAVADVWANEMLRRVDTLIPQFNGENVKLKNFKATIVYKTNLPNYRGALTVGFDETNAGYNVAVNYNNNTNFRRSVTGSTLVLGNGSGYGKRGDASTSYGAVAKDGWIFYDKQSLISATTVDDRYNTSTDGSIIYMEVKPGTDYIKGEQVEYARFDTDSTSQWLTLTVEVKDGKATFTTTSADGYRNETMEKAYDPRGGYFSIGMSGRDYSISYVDIVEYDENGNAVDFGTYHNSLKGVDKAVEIFEADFTDLPDAHYVNGQYFYNTNHDTATAQGVGLTNKDGATASSVGAYASSYKVDVKDKALVDYLESKFDFYTYANGGGLFEMWNAAGYIVDAEGNPLGSGFGNSNPHNPATGVAGGTWMPGNGVQGSYAAGGYYPTLSLSGNKWLHIANDLGVTPIGPFDLVYAYALQDANGNKAVVKNFKLDLDFKLTHPGYGSYAHNQSPLFIKFGGYDTVKKGSTDGAMFAISHNGGYFLDDLNTAVNGFTFTATQNSDGSPAYTEYIGGAAATQKVGEAHLTLTVKNGTVNAVVTLADGTEVLNVTKNDISIQNGLIQIGTTYAGMNHGLPYFGTVKVVRLDNDGNPIDFTDGDEGTFEAHFVGLTDVLDTCYYRNLGTKNNSILTGKANPWLTNAVGIANIDSKDNDGYAFGADDPKIVNYLNEKFDFYHAAPNGTLSKMATPYQNADEIYADSYSGGQWKLAGGRWLRATFDNGVHWADALRKQMILVPKMNDEAVFAKDLSLEFDFAHGSVNNGNSYSAALIMLRSAEVAKTKGAAGSYTDAIALRITHYGVTVYDGTAPANTMGHENDDQFKFGGNTYTAHISIKLYGNELKIKATSLDGSKTLFDETVAVENCTDAGYTYFAVCNSDMAFADIEMTPVPIEPEWIEGLPTYAGGYDEIVNARYDAKTFIIKGTNADTFNTYRASVEAAGWTKVSENAAADNLFATYQKDGQSVYMYYLAAENRVHVVKMEADATLPSAQAEYTKVCEPLLIQRQPKFDTATSVGMSYILRLSDGRFIVVDGGEGEPDYYESKELYRWLSEYNVLPKITIAAYIISHAHSDHVGLAGEFVGYYGPEDLTIEQFVFNFPTDEQCTAIGYGYLDPGFRDRFLTNMQKWLDAGAKRVTPYIGQEFYYADAKLEFLHTMDAYTAGQLDGTNFNNTTSVFSMEIAGQKFMMLGDMHEIGNDQLVKLYGAYLKSDIMQLAHHGVGGGTKEVYNAIDPTVVLNPASVSMHTDEYNYYRWHAPADNRAKQGFLWLYNNESGNVKEVITAGFKDVVLSLPYTPAENRDYFANRQNNGYKFAEPEQSNATVPTPSFNWNVGTATNTVYYKGQAYEVPSLRVEKSAAVLESQSIAAITGSTTFELFLGVDFLPDTPLSYPYHMFGNADMALTLEKSTLNANIRVGETNVLPDGSRYWASNVVGGGVVNHFVGTYNAETQTISIYQNGVLVTSKTGVTFDGTDTTLTLGSSQMNGLSGYTVLGARVYDTALTDEQVAAAYWNAINGMKHTCECNIPNYDENGHWNECACGEKDEVLPHALSYVNDGDKHYEKCACGYATEKADHDFADGDCVCGAQKPNTAKVEKVNGEYIITVKPADGYELKVGSLLVKDANGNYFVPERVGYRNGGNASQYKVPAAAGDNFTLPSNEELFYQPTGDNLNMDIVGVSTTESNNGGLRFVYRLNITEEDGKLYMLRDGAKVEVAEYGLLLAAEAIVKNPEDLDIETAKDSMHVHQFAWPEANKYFDKCAEYVDVSVHVVNILSNNGAKMNLISRAYVKLANGDVVYTDTFVGNYNEYVG